MSKRVVIVSGGTRGLGAEMVQGFLQSDDEIVVATFARSRTENTDQWLSDRHIADRVFFRNVDITDTGNVRAFVEEVWQRYGTIHALVNNAGVAVEGVLALASDQDISRAIDVNIRGTIGLTRACVRKMLLRSRGAIVNISSIVGISGFRGLSIYSATKAALDGFTRSLARELGSRGITVNSVAPGYLRTEMTRGLSERELEQIIRRTPLQRLGEPADVVPVVVFLCSDGARFITGQTIIVDGGITA